VTSSTTARRLAALVATCLIVASCQPSPTASPTAPASSGAPASAAASSAPASPAAKIPLADELRDAIDVDAIVADLGRLQSIAAEHGGARPAGSDGHAAAADFVADQLRAAGYSVELQPVDVPFFRQLEPSVLQVEGGAGFDDVHDFKAMLFSASGELTAAVFALGFNPAAQPGDRAGLGCKAEDWADVPAGSIVLVQAAGCRRRDVVVQAQAAGALALVTAYPEWERDEVLRPTLISPNGIQIPVLGVTEATGKALDDAAAAGKQVHISTRTSVETRSSVNVIGETPGGDANHVVMLGGHLDSVIDGPGINDDGSGTMTVLEIARELAALQGKAGSAAPGWKVRVGFWTGEEIGLLGSTAWVGRSGAPPLSSIAVYLNLDMLGSPNGGRFVYDGATTTRPAQSGVVSQLFVRALEAAGLVWQSVSVGSSDNVPFDQFGIPSSGLFSGANEIKSPGQAELFGGTGGAPADACFHLACDTTANIDRKLLGELARAAGWVVGALASGEVDLGSS
jgi:Zn-dependent M28 family amino/carboxypeptidase